MKFFSCIAYSTAGKLNIVNYDTDGREVVDPVAGPATTCTHIESWYVARPSSIVCCGGRGRERSGDGATMAAASVMVASANTMATNCDLMAQEAELEQ